MTKHATLKSKLHKSLSHIKPTAGPRVVRVPGTVRAEGEGIARKLSVSLHPADLAVAATIQAELSKAGRYVTISEALKVAIRGFEPNAKRILELYESLKDTDRRRRE